MATWGQFFWAIHIVHDRIMKGPEIDTLTAKSIAEVPEEVKRKWFEPLEDFSGLGELPHFERTDYYACCEAMLDVWIRSGMLYRNRLKELAYREMSQMNHDPSFWNEQALQENVTAIFEKALEWLGVDFDAEPHSEKYEGIGGDHEILKYFIGEIEKFGLKQVG